MKKKVMSVFFPADMGCAVGYQPAVSAQRCAGSGWCVCLGVMLPRLAACCAVRCRGFAGDRARDEVRAALLKFRAHPVKPVRTWVIRLLIVLCLAFSGWVITLVFYLLTLVLYQIARAQLHEPMAA